MIGDYDDEKIEMVFIRCCIALIQTDNYLRGGAERAFVLGIENLNRLTLLHFHSLGLFTDRYQPFGGNGLISL